MGKRKVEAGNSVRKPRIYYRAELPSVLGGATIVVDTSFIIDLSKVPELRMLYEELQKRGCKFVCLPPVATEFMCVAKSIDERAGMRLFLKSLEIEWLQNVEEEYMSSRGALFQMMLNRCQVNNPSYVDKLLMFAVYVLSAGAKTPVRLISSNHKDIACEIFFREELIVVDNNAAINNIGVYAVDYGQLIKKLESVK